VETTLGLTAGIGRPAEAMFVVPQLDSPAAANTNILVRTEEGVAAFLALMANVTRLRQALGDCPIFCHLLHWNEERSSYSMWQAHAARHIASSMLWSVYNSTPGSVIAAVSAA
jgi:hypothetical protein